MNANISWLSKFATMLANNYQQVYSYDDLMHDLDNSGRSGLIARIGEDGDQFAVNKLKTMWKHYRIIKSEKK